MCNKGKLKCLYCAALFRNVYWLIDFEFKLFLHIVKDLDLVWVVSVSGLGAWVSKC